MLPRYGTILVLIQAGSHPPIERKPPVEGHTPARRHAARHLSCGNNNEDRWRSDFVILRAPNREARLCSCARRTLRARSQQAGGSSMNRSELESIARAMVAKGKGILAADESSGTIKKRFDSIKLESTEEARRTYRELLFTAPGAADYISGVILYDETIRQKTKDGTPFPQYLQQARHHPGHQGRHRREAARRLPERDDHRRPRRAARASRRVPQARRALRQVARRDRHRRGLSRRSSRSTPTRMRSRATPRCARKRTSCRSSSRKC